MAQFNTEVFQLFQDFKENNIEIDWGQIAEDKDLQEQLEDTLDSLIHTAPFLTTIDTKEKTYLLGSLLIAHAQIVRLSTDDSSVEQWVKVGSDLEKILKDLLFSGAWLQEADKRFDELVNAEEKFARDEVSPAELDYFAPVLVALSVLSLLHIGQEGEDEEDDAFEDNN